MKHVPVLVKEMIKILDPLPGDYLLDATVGTGGHSRAFLEAASPGGKVAGLDADPMALEEAKKNLAKYGDRVRLVQGNFGGLKDSLTGGGILTSNGGKMFSSILFDLGMGSHQIGDEARVFSFRSKGKLTMRYGEPSYLPLAQLQPLNYLTDRLGYYPDLADIVRYMRVEEITELIRHYGEERYANRIAQAVKKAGAQVNGAALAQAIRNVVPKNYERGRIDPATRTWQALRLAVNRELECLTAALPQAAQMLAPGGVLAVISFHSLEDRIVKRYLKGSGLSVLTKKPLVAGQEERRMNPRSRSAKLRVAKLT